MSLWDLLSVLCFAMPIAGAVASARLAKAGFRGYALAITIGLALGVSCAWTVRTAGKTVDAHVKRHSESVQERYFRALYFAAMLWIVFGLFLGAWASSVLMRVVL
jgi:hypothetical protein